METTIEILNYSHLFSGALGAILATVISHIVQFYKERFKHNEKRILNLDKLVQEYVNSTPYSLGDIDSKDFKKYEKLIIYRGRKGINLGLRFGRTDISYPSNKMVLDVDTIYKDKVVIIVLMEKISSPFKFELRLARLTKIPHPDRYKQNIKYLDLEKAYVFDSCADAIEKGVELAEIQIKTSKYKDSRIT